jgi:hypothetical protein
VSRTAELMDSSPEPEPAPAHPRDRQHIVQPPLAPPEPVFPAVRQHVVRPPTPPQRAYPPSRPRAGRPTPVRSQGVSVKPRLWIAVIAVLAVTIVAYLGLRSRPAGAGVSLSLAGCPSVAPGGSTTCTVTVNSKGPGALKITGVKVIPAKGKGATWSVINTCAQSVPAGQKCTVSATLTAPESASEGSQFAAQLQFGDNAAPSGSRVPLLVTVASGP